MPRHALSTSIVCRFAVELILALIKGFAVELILALIKATVY
jgi:hypothetical protein